jgi:F-type H+-transporting ATPase subunit delta
MAELSTIARPYAEAVFSLASEESKLGDWSDMLALAATVAADADMQTLIGNTNINKAQLTGLFLDICGDKLTEQGKNLIKVLVENRRLVVLPEIASQFEALKAEAEKTVDAEVISAFEVSQTQQQQIADQLKQRLGREVSLTCRVDESLLGGVVIKAGDLVIDGSAVGQIHKLSVELAR